MKDLLNHFWVLMLSCGRDLLPIILVIGFFQVLVVQQPIDNFIGIISGTLLVVTGLAFFLMGLELSLFPVGETMANALAKKGSVLWLVAFAFALGFGTTVAEPTLIAISDEAAYVAATSGIIENTESGKDTYSLGLRYTVAFSVGLAIVIGVLRILKGWPIHFMIAGGYGLVIIMTNFAPEEIIGIAYDSGGVTTSTITVPLVTALGIGLASAIQGRNPMLDGFGLIAFASLTPIIFVMAYGIVLS